jgi:hypothetical protein
MLRPTPSAFKIVRDPPIEGESVGHVNTIAQVLARMKKLDADLPPTDGVRWFNKLYMAVTQGVADNVGRMKQHAPGFLERLDVVFANLYFDALDAAAGHRHLPDSYPYRAWKPLFDRRQRRDIAPIQFALAGMNAHINHDLTLAAQDTCRDRGVGVKRGSGEYEDYTAVNTLIERVEREVKVWLLTGALGEVDRRFGPVDDIIAIWSVSAARDAAWTHAEVLSHLSDTGFVERHYRDVLDRTTGAYSRALLRPVGFFDGAPLIPLVVDAKALAAALPG